MVHPSGRAFWTIFLTFGGLTSWFWMVFDRLFGSNRQNCSKTVEIAAKAIYYLLYYYLLSAISYLLSTIL